MFRRLLFHSDALETLSAGESLSRKHDWCNWQLLESPRRDTAGQFLCRRRCQSVGWLPAQRCQSQRGDFAEEMFSPERHSDATWDGDGVDRRWSREKVDRPSPSLLLPRSSIRGISVSCHSQVIRVATGLSSMSSRRWQRQPRWQRRRRRRRWRRWQRGRRYCGTVSDIEWFVCWKDFRFSSALCSRAMCRLTVLFRVNVREQNGHGTLIPWWRCRMWARRFVS